MKKMRNKNKMRVIILLMLTTMLTLGYTKIDAVLQTRPGVAALVYTTVSSFFEKIRGMEKVDGGFGLNATFVTEGGTYKETSASNNIDVHMLKNTEWGGAAMLSASNYGAGNGKVTNTYNSTTKLYAVTASTTGNMSGVFGMYRGLGYYEYVSAGIVGSMSSSYTGNIKNAENRYVDKYADGADYNDFSKYIPGDATFETKTFSGGGGAFVYSGGPVFVRGSSGVFYSNNASGSSGGSYGSRVGVWSGVGI